MFSMVEEVKGGIPFDCTKETFHQTLQRAQVADTCAAIARLIAGAKAAGLTEKQLDDKKKGLKEKLPAFCFHATFGGRERRVVNATPSGLVMYDVDHIGDARAYWEAKKALLEQKGVMHIIGLAHVSASGDGLHIVFRQPQRFGADIAAAQRWMSDAIEDSRFDGGCKDLARCSFAVPTDYVLYEDDAVLFAEAPTADGNDAEKGRPQGPHPAGDDDAQAALESATPPHVGAPLVGTRTPERRTETADTTADGNVLPEHAGGHPASRPYKGMPTVNAPESSNSQILDNQKRDGADSANSQILDNQKRDGADSANSQILDNRKADGADSKILEQTAFPQNYDGVPYSLIVDRLVEQLGGVPAHGSRNNFIFALACRLRYLCDDNAQWIKSIIPTFGELRQKVDATVQSACNRSQSPVTPAIVKRALLLARREAAATADDSQQLPPPMPRLLPPLIKLLVKNTPREYRAAVAHAVFPALAAHLWHTQFRYIDNVLHEATLMNVLMAGTGAGKDCITRPINHIMKDIRERDARNMQREREWKEEVNSKGSNKDKRKRPEGLIIQEVDPDMTNPAFVMRMAEADGHFLYVKMNELDQFDALRGSGRGGQQFKIMCLAFDPDNQYGQTRVGTQSITERVTVRFNWNAATTIQKGQRYFANVLTDGPISRINFCTIPEREIGDTMPVYGTYDADYDEQLSPYIKNLCEARGVIDIPGAEKLAWRLRNELAEYATLNYDRTFENLSFRANVIAWLKGCVLYVAQGGKWDKRIEDFVRWSLQYDMWCKMRFFGQAIEESVKTAPRGTQRGPQNLLQQLPDVFTEADVVNVRLSNGLDANSAKRMLRVWKSRNYIAAVSDNFSFSYRKLKFRQDGVDLTKNRA